MKFTKKVSFDWRTNLRLLRSQSGLTGKHFAEIIGIGYQTLIKIEAGIHSMNLEKLNLLLVFFNMTLEDFCTLHTSA